MARNPDVSILYFFKLLLRSLMLLRMSAPLKNILSYRVIGWLDIQKDCDQWSK